MERKTTLYKRHRFPLQIIQHAVWLYSRFNLSQRDIEDPLARRRHRGYGDTFFLDELPR